MDKSPGDPLNRAYEAFRLACIDKDRFKKELQQKKEVYEQHSREQKKQIEFLSKRVLQLTSQLSEVTATGVHNLPQSPKLENKDGWKGDSICDVSLEHLQQQLRVATQREKHYKEQLKLEKLQFLAMEEKRDQLLSTLTYKNEEIQHLKVLLKEANERREKQDGRIVHGQEQEVRSKTLNPQVSAASVISENERQGAELVFTDLKEQFDQICTLTRKQSNLLKKITERKIQSGIDTCVAEFPMPIQCTDEEESQEVQILLKKKEKMDPSHLTPITPRGLTQDDDVAISVESLSNLSVKFPPSNDNSEFLESSTEKLPVLPPALEPLLNPSKVQMEASFNLRKFNTAVGSPPYSPRSPRTGGHIDHVKELGANYEDSFVAEAEDSSLFLAAISPPGRCKNVFRMPDVPSLNASIDTVERTVRGPQQLIWKPSSHPHDDPSIAVGEKWDRNSSNVCEFCQAVFPPSTRDKEDFLRHLNSHFKNKS